MSAILKTLKGALNQLAPIPKAPAPTPKGEPASRPTPLRSLGPHLAPLKQNQPLRSRTFSEKSRQALVPDTRLPTPALPLTPDVPRGKILHYSEPQFLHLQNGNNATYLRDCHEELEENF